MADDAYDDSNEDQTGESHDIRELRRKAREADELQARLASLEREHAFVRAGVAVDDPKFKYFVKAYDGDLTPEAIRSELEQTGLTQPARSSAPAADPNDAAHQRMAMASTGGAPPAELTWRDALAEADRITNEQDRTQAILDVVERFGGTTSHSAQ